MIDLRAKPFNLSDEEVSWVESTIAVMSEDEKIGQLFCLIGWGSDETYLKNLLDTIQPGGFMCRPMPAAETVATVSILQKHSKLPMLIAANLEKGGNGLVTDGTYFGAPMQVAATDDIGMAAKLGTVCGREAAAVGGNWAFAPIIDIDYNFRNPITNLRTFGSDPERVKRMGVAYVEAVQEQGVAASIKHFPGDGVDERDQHLVTSINSMSCEDWDRTYGEAYRAGIEAGAMTCMIGHIAHPAWSKALAPGIADADILPASLAREITTTLLRGRLGFNGLVVTDASTMAGMVIAMPRPQVVPAAIAAGCDMFLFTRNLEEDYGYMKRGFADGVITAQRLDEAVTRILALKAALKLPAKKLAGSLVPTSENAASSIATAEHLAWARDCADRAITMVKEERGVLPLSASRYRRVLFYGIESQAGIAYSVRVGAVDSLRQRLEAEGFLIDVFAPSPSMEGMVTPWSSIVGKYDLM
jgi:beta-N-acetylhexosaminidase